MMIMFNQPAKNRKTKGKFFVYFIALKKGSMSLDIPSIVTNIKFSKYKSTSYKIK